MTREINWIVIHCSDTPNGRPNTVEDIRSWHVDGNGWDDIGYHYVIETTGEVKKGREDDTVGAHASGFNKDSIGICMVGRDKFTGGQWAALHELVDTLTITYENVGVIGHNVVSEKTCPNFDVTKWMRERMPRIDNVL